ncbi:MAG: signal peptidase II [Acidimicrobiales bacterium]
MVTALIVAVGVVLVDRFTKMWAESRLVAGPCRIDTDGCIDVIGSLRFHLVENRGAAFSTGTGLGPVFAVIAVGMSAYLLHLTRHRTDRWGPIVLGAIVGGAVGNLIDRVVRAESGPLTGPVIDFIDVQWWPVFNVADIAVVVGVIVFALMAIVSPEPEPADSEPDETGDPDGPDPS